MIRNILYHLGLLGFFKLNYFEFLKEYKLIKRSQYKSIKYNTHLQKNRLFKLVDYALQNIPYYKEIQKEKNIKISKNSIFQDIKKFPILTKDIIRKNWDRLHSNLDNQNYIINTSGGTTGEPVRVIQSERYSCKSEASTIAFDEIGSYKLGKKKLWLWGDETEIFGMTQGFIQRFKNRIIKNAYYKNAFRLSDKIDLKFIKEINTLKPNYILSYVQSIYELAKFIEKHNLFIYSPKAIITSAGILTYEMKNYIENVFNCRVFNRYGSREVGLIAMSCEESEKLHINMYQHYIEILDENKKNVDEHERGDIIITNLINYAMPLIRYRIGDRGSFDNSQCDCGRGLIQFDNIFGRVVDIFKNEMGDLIDGEYFTHLFYFRENLKQFQVIQEKIDKITIKIVTRNKKPLSQSIENEIIQKIKLVMGESCEVEFNYLRDIKPSPSGKIRYTISKIN